jgi:hypothetical protein
VQPLCPPTYKLQRFMEMGVRLDSITSYSMVERQQCSKRTTTECGLLTYFVCYGAVYPQTADLTHFVSQQI